MNEKKFQSKNPSFLTPSLRTPNSTKILEFIQTSTNKKLKPKFTFPINLYQAPLPSLSTSYKNSDINIKISSHSKNSENVIFSKKIEEIPPEVPRLKTPNKKNKGEVSYKRTREHKKTPFKVKEDEKNLWTEIDKKIYNKKNLINENYSKSRSKKIINGLMKNIAGNKVLKKVDWRVDDEERREKRSNSFSEENFRPENYTKDNFFEVDESFFYDKEDCYDNKSI